MKKHLPLLLTGAAFLALTLFSQNAAAGARDGLRLCAMSLIPSLFPFFVLARLLSALGLPDLLAGKFGNAMARLFRVSGAGAQAFFLGVSGGYPLGASVTAQLRRDALVSRAEAERLLAFCNNSGPAFILGAAAGVLQSPKAGFLLYITHVLAAVCVGILFRGGAPVPTVPQKEAAQPKAGTAPTAPRLSSAIISEAVAGAVSAVLNVCGYVVLFRALLAMVPPLPLPPVAAALFTGFFELGSGISALGGCDVTPLSLSAAALMLGWGGLSVHGQTLGAVGGTDIKCARHLLGRALCGLIAAVFTYVLSLWLFP